MITIFMFSVTKKFLIIFYEKWDLEVNCIAIFLATLGWVYPFGVILMKSLEAGRVMYPFFRFIICALLFFICILPLFYDDFLIKPNLKSKIGWTFLCFAFLFLFFNTLVYLGYNLSAPFEIIFTDFGHKNIYSWSTDVSRFKTGEMIGREIRHSFIAMGFIICIITWTLVRKHHYNLYCHGNITKSEFIELIDKINFVFIILATLFTYINGFNVIYDLFNQSFNTQDLYLSFKINVLNTLWENKKTFYTPESYKLLLNVKWYFVTPYIILGEYLYIFLYYYIEDSFNIF